MVDLPKVPRRLATTEAPRSSLTAADIKAPYGSLVSAMQEGADALTDVADAHVADAAAQAVVTSADGSITVEPSAIPMVGKTAVKYRNHIQVAAVAAADASADRALIDLRAESRGDPGTFISAAQAYRDKKVSDLGGSIGPAGGAALRRQVDSRITSIYGGLQNERQRVELASADHSLVASITTAGDEMETLARRNGIGEDYQQRLGNVRALLQQRVNAPLSTFTNEQADLYLDQLNTRVQGAAIHEQAERVYRERGFDAARDYLRSSVRELDGKVKHLDKIERTGMTWLRAEEAGMRGERDIVSREWAAARTQARDLDPAVLDDIEARAQAVGNSRVALDIAVTRRAIETVAAVRSMSAEEQARSIGQGGLVNSIVRAESGGNPNARATTSSATGAGQFIKGTWLDLVRRTRPDIAEGKTEDQILALRTNPELSREMVGRYAEENRQRLASAGVSTDDGALYLAHFLGPGDATKVLAAAPGASLQGIVAPASIAANQSIFSRNPTAGQLTAWAAGKVDVGNRANLIARQMIQRDLRGDLGTTLTGMQARVDRGEFPSADEVDRLGSLAASVGTPEQRRKAATIAAISEHGAAFQQQMSAPQRDAIIAAWDDRLKGRSSQGESDLGQALRKANQAMRQQYQTDPWGAYFHWGGRDAGGARLPVDFSQPQDAAAIIGLRAKAQPAIREEQGLGPFSVLRPSEAEALRGTLANGSAQTVSGVFAALNRLPDDMLAATLKDSEVKAGITGAIHTTDPAKYNAVMASLDAWYARDPQGFNARFGEEAWNSLKDWQAKLRYVPAEQLAEERRQALDPQVAARRKVNEDKGQELWRKKTPAQVVAAFDQSWIGALTPGWTARNITGTQAHVPVDPGTRDALMSDGETVFKRRYASTLDPDIALRETVEHLRTKWGRSEVNGGRLMLRAPEQVYPAINGEHKWMAPQIEAAIAEQMGVPRSQLGTNILGGAVVPVGLIPVPVPVMRRNWDYLLVPDRATETDAQRYDRALPVGAENRAPSYQVMIRDNRRQAPKLEPLRDGQGRSFRFAFDPNPEQARAREGFETRRNRATAPLQSIGEMMQAVP